MVPMGMECHDMESYDSIHPSEIIERITSSFEGVFCKKSWGESAFFYNPDNLLPNGVYFATLKEHDGENDKASHLDREGIYRLSIGVPKDRYRELFGEKPKRPLKGGIVDIDCDFTACDIVQPHPIYAWMSWVAILSPSHAKFEEIFPLVESAYKNSVDKFNKQRKKRL